MTRNNEIRRQLSGMPTGENKMADMEFSIRRPMQEARDHQKLLEAYRLDRLGVAAPSKLTEAHAKAAVTGLPFAYRFDPATGDVTIISYQELISDSEGGEP